MQFVVQVTFSYYNNKPSNLIDYRKLKNKHCIKNRDSPEYFALIYVTKNEL